MARKGENIFKRKDGRWEARYIHHYENGKAKYRYLYDESYSRVKAKKNAAMAGETVLQEARKDGWALRELAPAWLLDVRSSVKESTYTRYHRAVEQYIVPKLGEIPLGLIDAGIINRFAEDMLRSGGKKEEGLSPKTVTDLLCVIKSILLFAARIGVITAPPVGIRYPQKQQKQVHIFENSERKALEEALLGAKDPDSLGILCSAFLGLRIGEVCGLRWEDLDRDCSMLRICRTVERIADLGNSTQKTKIIVASPKTESAFRVIPIPRFLSDLIIRIRDESERSGYLLSGSEAPVEPHTFYRRYKRFLKENGISDHTFHALRHTFATRCVEAGFDTKSLSEILGHASITTTMAFYVHPSMESKRNQMERLAPDGI